MQTIVDKHVQSATQSGGKWTNISSPRLVAHCNGVSAKTPAHAQSGRGWVA